MRSRACGVERHPLATARFHIKSGRKPWGPVSSDREGIKGGGGGSGVQQEKCFGWEQKYWQAEQGSVKGPGIKDKGKVSTTQSVWRLMFGRDPGRQREAHPIKRALCLELSVLESKEG